MNWEDQRAVLPRKATRIPPTETSTRHPDKHQRQGMVITFACEKAVSLTKTRPVVVLYVALPVVTRGGWSNCKHGLNNSATVTAHLHDVLKGGIDRICAVCLWLRHGSAVRFVVEIGHTYGTILIDDLSTQVKSYLIAVDQMIKAIRVLKTKFAMTSSTVQDSANNNNLTVWTCSHPVLVTGRRIAAAPHPSHAHLPLRMRRAHTVKVDRADCSNRHNTLV